MSRYTYVHTDYQGIVTLGVSFYVLIMASAPAHPDFNEALAASITRDGTLGIFRRAGGWKSVVTRYACRAS